jgi:hypothetical protein
VRGERFACVAESLQGGLGAADGYGHVDVNLTSLENLMSLSDVVICFEAHLA